MENGFDLVSGGTDNHLFLVDLRSKNVTGKDFEKMLDSVQITVNKNTIPNDPQTPFVTSGIRVGTAAVTTRGFTTDDMKLIAKAFALTAADLEGNREEILQIVNGLTQKHPLYQLD